MASLRTKDISIIDLRQESHGFLNGNAISWYAPGNAANIKLTDQEIENEQDRLLDDLNHQEFVKVATVLSKTNDEEVKQTKSTEFTVHKISSEEQVANDYHLKYHRVYVTDHHAPSDAEVDRFINIISLIPANQWIYFHCLAGVGRTTVFMSMYDMMHNAKTLSFDEILDRNALQGGKDLRLLPKVGEYKYEMSVKRLMFLKQFYQYAHDNSDNFKTTWTEWKNHDLASSKKAFLKAET